MIPFILPTLIAISFFILGVAWGRSNPSRHPRKLWSPLDIAEWNYNHATADATSIPRKW